MSLTLPEMRLVEGWLREYPAGVPANWWMSREVNGVEPCSAGDVLDNLKRSENFL